MLNLRYVVRLISAFITRFKILLIAGTLVGVGLFFFFRIFSPYMASKVDRIGIFGRFTLDNLPDSILRLSGNGLTKIKENAEVEPDLAKAWTTSDEGKTWVFELREDAFWQDGRKVVSSDVIYDFSDVQIEKPDSKTIVFKLENPLSPFPAALAKPIFKRGLLGTGEWRVSKLRLAGSYVSELVLVNKKRERKIYRFYPTEERAKLAFKLGQVNILSSVFNPKPFTQWKTVELQREVNRNQYVAVFFNNQDKLLGEKGARQALSYAIDKAQFEGERAIGPISPNSWAFNPQIKPYDVNQERAKTLLKDLPKELKENLSIRLVTTPVLLEIAEKIAKDWGNIGVKTTLQVASSLPTEYQALLAVFDIPADPDQYAVWHSTRGATNFARYKNPRIDKLLEDGRTKLDKEERKKIYLDFQRFLVEDSPAIFLYHPVSYTIKRR